MLFSVSVLRTDEVEAFKDDGEGDVDVDDVHY